MRDDYDKIICERPRLYASKTYKHVRRSTVAKDDEYSNLSNKESMRRPYGYERKQFNDYLNPLYRWLDKQVGRPWDKVQSDLHQMLDSRKTTDQHVWDHVKREVQERVIKEDGKVLVLNEYIGAYEKLRSGKLYVWNGILKKNKLSAKKVYPRYKKEVEPVYLYEPDGFVYQYEKLGAMWHFVTYQWKVQKPGEYSVNFLRSQVIGQDNRQPVIAVLVKTGGRTMSKEEVVSAGLT